jgi:hypothetical protein
MHDLYKTRARRTITSGHTIVAGYSCLERSHHLFRMQPGDVHKSSVPVCVTHLSAILCC